MMRVLVADDDPVLRHALTSHLQSWGYTSAVVMDGGAALNALQQPDPPLLAIIDWNMPGVDGTDLCRYIRATPALAATYVILLTGNQDRSDVVAGLESGADDYIIKPFSWEELRARLRIGSRIAGLQQALAARVDELQHALGNVKRLSGLLPICAYCKKIRNSEDYWMQVEQYLANTRTPSSAMASARSACTRNCLYTRPSKIAVCPIPNSSSPRCATS